MTGDLSFEKRTKKGACCFTVLWQCPHNRPSRHGYLLATDYKNHPVRRIRISKQKIVKPNVRINHDWEQESLMQIFMSDHIGNILICETTTHHFFLFVCHLFVALLCLYFLCKLELFWAWPSYTRIPTFKTTTDFLFPIPIHTHMRHLLSLCRLL